MPKSLAHLVAVLLLGMQALIAFVPGRMLCVHVAGCRSNEPSEAVSACGHRGFERSLNAGDGAGSACGGVAESACGSVHGLFELAVHPDDSCECHVHVPVPGENPVPLKAASRGESTELRELAVPLPVVAITVRDWIPTQGLEAYAHEPDFGRSSQLLSLRSTRLLI